MPAATATFDTLKFANTLKAAGVPDKQAEAQAVAFAEVMQLNLKDLVTKDDLATAAKDVRQEIKDVREKLDGSIAAVKDDLATAVKDVRQEIKDVREKLDGSITAVKNDQADAVKGLRQEIKEFRDELKQETKDQRDELKQLIKDVDQRLTARMDVMAAQHRGEIVLMRWMLGVCVTAVVGILIRLFVYRTPL